MTEQRETVSAYFAAMRRGAEGESDLLDLFTDDAIYTEPFSGSTDAAVGIDAIRRRFRSGWEQPLPDMELDVHSVDVVGSEATSRWECRSSALPAPVRGTDHYAFRDGRIAELRVTIDELGPSSPEGHAASE